MEAVKFFKEINRLCKDNDCDDLCPLMSANDCLITILYEFSSDNMTDKKLETINDLINRVENWSKEHPQKTLLDDLLEKLPNIPLNEDKTQPYGLCPYDLGYVPSIEYCAKIINNDMTCAECWNQPLEEVVKENK